MPVIISCPDCQQSLRIPDNLLSSIVRCPECRRAFTPVMAADEHVRAGENLQEVAAQPEQGLQLRDGQGDVEGPDDEYDEREAARAARRAWGYVRTGLHLNVIGTWVWVGGFALLIFLTVLVIISESTLAIASRDSPFGGKEYFNWMSGVVGVAAPPMMILFCVCGVAEVVLRLIGTGMCMAVPLRRGAALKGLAISSFAVGSIGAVMALVGLIYSLLDRTPWSWVQPDPFHLSPANVFRLLGIVLGQVGVILFLLFARSAAQRLRASRPAGAFLILLVLFCIIYVTGFVLGRLYGTPGGRALAGLGLSTGLGMSRELSGGTVFFAIFLLLIAAASYVGLVIWYAASLADLRNAAVGAR